MTIDLPLIAIIGRPNVGKSTLFNRVAGARLAIVHNEPGVTRDRFFASAEFNRRSFLLVDTAGITLGKRESQLEQDTERQALLALESADLVWLVLDGRDGCTGVDEKILQRLRRRSQPPFMVVVNKVDDPGQAAATVADFYRLGVANLYAVSGEHNRGVDVLLGASLDCIKAPKQKKMAKPVDCTLALIGRPNSGKSSLLNALVGHERAVVSAAAGTTRDTIHELLRHGGKTIRIADTAGLRRKPRITSSLEYYSTVRALKAIAEADVCALLLDPTQDTAEQEKRLARTVWDEGKGLIYVVSKKDVFENTQQQDRHQVAATDFIHFLPGVPLLHVSSQDRQGLRPLLETTLRVARNRHQHVPTGPLVRWARSLSIGNLRIMYAAFVSQLAIECDGRCHA